MIVTSSAVLLMESSDCGVFLTRKLLVGMKLSANQSSSLPPISVSTASLQSLVHTMGDVCSTVLR